MLQLPNLEILVVAALATWRISCLLYYEHGPWDVFERLRYRAGVYAEPQAFWGKQLSCFWCVSGICGLLCGIAAFLWWPILIPFGLSAAAVLLSGGGRIIWRSMTED